MVLGTFQVKLMKEFSIDMEDCHIYAFLLCQDTCFVNTQFYWSLEFRQELIK